MIRSSIKRKERELWLRNACAHLNLFLLCALFALWDAFLPSFSCSFSAHQLNNMLLLVSFRCCCFSFTTLLASKFFFFLLFFMSVFSIWSWVLLFDFLFCFFYSVLVLCCTADRNVFVMFGKLLFELFYAFDKCSHSFHSLSLSLGFGEMLCFSRMFDNAPRSLKLLFVDECARNVCDSVWLHFIMRVEKLINFLDGIPGPYRITCAVIISKF